MNRCAFGMLAVLVAAGAANADLPQLYCTGFEAPDYAVGVLTGQDEWFLPVAGSSNYNVAAYGGPIAANPDGGSHYAIGASGASPAFARAQHFASFVNNTTYSIMYDVNVLPWGGKPPAVNNIGSFSTQDSVTSRTTQSLFVYNDLNNPAAGWTTQYISFAADGATSAFVTPANAAFTGLATNHWYRQALVVDFTTNEVLSISITDLATNVTTTVPLTGVYMGGGANNVQGRPMPEAFRMFAGGGVGNTVLWDNVCIEVIPAPAAGMLGLLGLGALTRRRR